MDGIPDTPAEIDAHIEHVQTAYRNGYRDGASDVARSFGYTVEETETPAHSVFGTTFLFVLSIACAFFVLNLILSNTERFPRVENRAV